MTPAESLLFALEKAGPLGLRLVASRDSTGAAFIVAYSPAETPDEAGEKPIGFLALSSSGEATAIPAPVERGTPPETADTLLGEALATLRALAGSEATSLRPRGTKREGRDA